MSFFNLILQVVAHLFPQKNSHIAFINKETNPLLTLTQEEKTLFESISNTTWDEYTEDIGLVYDEVDNVLQYTEVKKN